MSRYFLVSYNIISDSGTVFGDISFSTGGLFFSREGFVKAVKKEYPKDNISKFIITNVFEFKTKADYEDYIFKSNR